MVFDKIENLEKYGEIQPFAERIKKFICQAEEENLPQGCYNLCGNQLFALVQVYETKEFDMGRMEAHKKYADLQYILEGEERVYVDFTENLELEEDRTPEADILFFTKGKNKAYHILGMGTFGYYAPQDAHMPCIKNIEKKLVKKIVFKIAIK